MDLSECSLKMGQYYKEASKIGRYVYWLPCQQGCHTSGTQKCWDRREVYILVFHCKSDAAFMAHKYCNDLDMISGGSMMLPKLLHGMCFTCFSVPLTILVTHNLFTRCVSELR